MSELQQPGRGRMNPAFATILGTNEIASAVAIELHRAGYGVVLSHDPMPPVIRRKMAFHDALFEDSASVDGVRAERADTGVGVRAGLARNGVMVTNLGLLDLIVLGSIDLLVDARMNKYQVTPDLRRLARLTIGLGPGFSGGTNCDLAIETRPGKEGQIIQHGPTDAPDGVARPLGAVAAERFVHSQVPGRWHSAIEIGTRVFKDFHIGYLGNDPIRAPFDGVVRGVVRDGTEVPAGVKLLEIDPRGRGADWTGLDARALVIAKAVSRALTFRGARLAETPPHPHLVK
ncbi:xanthine dehydrogenase [Xanthobacter dioxanivorans]|uniref:Xanthine dehydrogenase n=1 Tax=Xanthobacter dioxanivorans TaxID=2528964 RepID=A0A974PQ01_9HYPH|nr:xanthine dehydrogenase [Xanthobacter dioxanivorans]QRG07575.1 xanthine dehydrogenase [Xanthobacter dioxanivorans]